MGEGITQDKAERWIWENFTSTLSKQNHIQAQKIKKLKQYYLGINSCLRLTQPIYFVAFIVNSLPNFPLISTPPRLEIVCSALLWSPSYMLRCPGCWDNVSNKLLTKYLWVSPLHKPASCIPRRVSAGPVGPGHLLSCWPEKIKATSHSTLIIHFCLGTVKRCLSQMWSLSWGTGSVASGNWCRTCDCSPCLWPSDQSESEPGSISVTKFEVHFQEPQLTERIQFRASCPGCPSAEGGILAPSERGPPHPA